MPVAVRRLLASDAPAAVWLIRLLVGAVFVSEGIQKCLFPAELGVGRFTKIGIPSPEILAPVVGGVEIVGGFLLLQEGVWKMAHEACTDWSMRLGTLFLLLVGAGAWSLDALLLHAAPGDST
jgi:uncharacterized membrane protein YphA (DoxX/SURF4 family)